MVIMFTRRGRREELTLAHLLIHSFLTSGAGEQCSRTTLGRPVVATRWRKTWRIISHLSLSSRLNRFFFCFLYFIVITHKKTKQKNLLYSSLILLLVFDCFFHKKNFHSKWLGGRWLPPRTIQYPYYIWDPFNFQVDSKMNKNFVFG